MGIWFVFVQIFNNPVGKLIEEEGTERAALPTVG